MKSRQAAAMSLIDFTSTNTLIYSVPCSDGLIMTDTGTNFQNSRRGCSYAVKNR